jgi:ABC-type Na+ efflux pump permease subunit
MIVTPAWYLTVKLGIASAASQRLAEEKAGGTLELLLSTPLTPEEIARGVWLAVRHQFLWPAVATLVLIGVSAVVGAFFWTPMDTGERIGWLATGTAMAVMFVADIAALIWAGIWFGLAAKDVKQAAASTYAHIMALPTCVFILLLIAAMTLCALLRRDLPESYVLYLAGWFVIGIANDILHFIGCRNLYYTRVRELAASRYLPPEQGFWVKAGRWLGRQFKRR